MDVSLYAYPFLSSLLICTFITLVLIYSAGRFFQDTKKDFSRHIHERSISRFGGVALILSFVIAIGFDNNLVFSIKHEILIGSLFLILIFGVIDDIWDINWKSQLFFQISLAILTFIAGIRINYISSPFGDIIDFDKGGFFILLSFSIVVLWILLMMNAVNWIDGLDGLSGGVALIGVISVFILSLRPEVNQPPIGIMTMALSGALVAFLFFNFNPARIFAGTSGSMFMGYILAVLAIFAGAKIATTLLVMAVPLVDFFWVIRERFRLKQPIFKADNNHLHHRLLEIGWSQRKISLFYYFITATVALIALNTRSIGKILAIALCFLVISFAIFFISRYREIKINKSYARE